MENWDYYDDDCEEDDECRCGVVGCPECDERYCDENYDCGMMSNGQCTKAGSEGCDWECPERSVSGNDES